jgi:hypothetical protein
MAGHTRPRHHRATEAEARRYRVAPGTILARPTRAENRLRHYRNRHAEARTAEDRLMATVDYFRSVVSTAHKRDRDRHVPDVPGLDRRIGEVDRLLLAVTTEIENTGRIPRAPGRRP